MINRTESNFGSDEEVENDVADVDDGDHVEVDDHAARPSTSGTSVGSATGKKRPTPGERRKPRC